MKVLVYFQPSPKLANCEGVRLRKKIKGALEINDFPYTTNVYDDYDVAHFMSTIDEKEIDIVKERNIPIVISALCAENDISASFLEYKNKDGQRLISIKPKTLKVLNKADLILVPTEDGASFLRENGVESEIRVCLPGNNISRFDFSREDEKELFYRYYKEDPRKPIIISFGEYNNNLEGLNTLCNAAKKHPEAMFYFVGYKDANKGLKFGDRRKISKAPKNVKCRENMPEDIYRSALMNAKILVVSSYKPAGVITLQDAMAAKCQIVARRSAIPFGLLEDGVTAYLAEFSETIASVISDCLDGKQQPTTEEAYKQIANRNLEVFGKELIKIYEELKKAHKEE